MPWKEVSVMSQRKEFVSLAKGANIRELSRRFGISPTTAYKWMSRHNQYGDDGLSDHSRRPHNSPNRTCYEMEQRVVELRDAHPAWGGRKLRRRLIDSGHERVPSASTITAILKRNGRIGDEESDRHRAFIRFEHDRPNQLWQMDFKGHVPTLAGPCHPLTVLDDHSRFSLGIEACENESASTVKDRLTAIFRRYGMPHRMLMDNGSPWGSDSDRPHTILTAWLMRLGIKVSHSRPYHPQTQGKDERFHRTLKAEALSGRSFADIASCQRALDEWRHVYNFERPHQALDMEVPASRYQFSPKAFPESLPPIEYGDADVVRKVSTNFRISFAGRRFRVGRAFQGMPVALRPTDVDGVWNVFFCSHVITQIDLSTNRCDD